MVWLTRQNGNLKQIYITRRPEYPPTSPLNLFKEIKRVYLSENAYLSVQFSFEFRETFSLLLK